MSAAQLTLSPRTHAPGRGRGCFPEAANPVFEPIYLRTTLEVLGIVNGVVTRLRR